MPYEVPPLPYDYSALEPHIDEQTMRLHHDKHHQAYVDKANGAAVRTAARRAPARVVARFPLQPRGNSSSASERRRYAMPDEKPDMWKTMAATWPAYDEYQTKTDREIPVVVLDPR